MFEVPKNTLSTWKKHKEKIYENYERGLGATRVEPEKYEAVNKAVMKWLLIILDITSDGYIDFDIKVITIHGKLTNQEIPAEINDDVNRESDGEEEDPNDFGPINKPGIKYASEALQVLEDFSLFSKFWKLMSKSLKELNHSLDIQKLSHKKSIMFLVKYYLLMIS